MVLGDGEVAAPRRGVVEADGEVVGGGADENKRLADDPRGLRRPGSALQP